MFLYMASTALVVSASAAEDSWQEQQPVVSPNGDLTWIPDLTPDLDTGCPEFWGSATVLANLPSWLHRSHLHRLHPRTRFMPRPREKRFPIH